MKKLAIMVFAVAAMAACGGEMPTGDGGDASADASGDAFTGTTPFPGTYVEPMTMTTTLVTVQGSAVTFSVHSNRPIVDGCTFTGTLTSPTTATFPTQVCTNAQGMNEVRNMRAMLSGTNNDTLNADLAVYDAPTGQFLGNTVITGTRQ